MTEEQIQVEIARRFLVDCWMSFSQEPGCGWRTVRCTSMEKNANTMSGTPQAWASLPRRILEASPHLQGYDADCLPWAEINRLKVENGWNVIEALDYLGL